jgi:Fe-S-cluster containining protein
MNHSGALYHFHLQTLKCSFGRSDNAAITEIQPVMCTKFPHTTVPDTVHTYTHTLHFISQAQTNGHKNRHIKTKQAPVNKIIKTNFLCYAPHIRELYKKELFIRYKNNFVLKLVLSSLRL